MSDKQVERRAPISTRHGACVGRDDELKVLQEAAKRVLEDEKLRIVTVLGAQGIGKSCIVEQFVGGLEAPGMDRLRVVKCTGNTSAMPTGLVGQLLRCRFGLGDRTEGSVDLTRRKLQREVASILGERNVRDVLFFLGQIVGVSFPDSALTRVFEQGAPDGEVLRRSILRTLLAKDAAKRPLVLVLDDLDQARSDSLQLIYELLDGLDAPILVVAVARTNLDHVFPSWRLLNEQRHEVIDVQPLGKSECASLLERLLSACDEIPEKLIETACSMAGGNPALLEQMIQIYLDKGVLEEVSSGDRVRWVAHVDRLASVRLPLTVEEVIRARVAALSSEQRMLLERAAVMGSVFWRGALLVMARRDASVPPYWVPGDDSVAERMDELLEQLTERDYILEILDSTFVNEREFVFKHRLEREHILALLSTDTERALHKTIADWLEQQQQEDVQDEYWEYIAQHREKAGEVTEAGLSYLDAGDVARSQYAWHRAVKYYEKGLALLGEHQVWRRIDALHNMGDVLLSLGELEQALEAFDKMRVLAFKLNLLHKGGAAHNRIGRALRDAGKLKEAKAHLSAGLSLFEMAGDERGVASSLDDIGKLLWLRGQYEDALEKIADALARRRRIGDRRSIALSLNNMGLAQQDSGMFREARESFESALRIRQEIGDRMGAVITLNNLGTIAQDQGDFSRAAAVFEEALVAAEELGDKFRIALVLVNLGESRRALGQTEQAKADLERSVRLSKELKDELSEAEALRVLSGVLMDLGELTQARENISRAVEVFTKAKSKSQLGIALRSLAEVTAGGGWGDEHVARASDYYERSVKMLAQIGNDVELAKTLVSFASFLEHHVPERKEEVKQMRIRARDVFERLGIAQHSAEQD